MTTTPGRALPLFPSERVKASAGARRLGPDTLRAALAEATRRHLPGWDGKLTPHVLRHYCASQLYLNGMDLIAIQEALGPRLGSHHDAVRARPPRPCRAGLDGRSAARRAAAGRADLNALEPAAGRGEPRHLEGLGAAAPARRARAW